jgi:hypothetical protein
MRALGAVTAILGTAACLDREQTGQLDRIILEAAMNGLGLINKIKKWCPEQGLNFFDGPVMTEDWESSRAINRMGVR